LILLNNIKKNFKNILENIKYNKNKKLFKIKLKKDVKAMLIITIKYSTNSEYNNRKDNSLKKVMKDIKKNNEYRNTNKK
jgi:hypothetical protein